MLPNKKYTLADAVDIVRRRFFLIVVPAMVTLLAALVHSSGLPDVYRAETLIQVVPQRVPDNFVPTTVTIRSEERIGSLGQQVQSRTQLERIIQELNLYADARARLPMQDIVEMMRSNVDVQPVRQNNTANVDAFFVRFSYGDPVMAARVTERLGMLYVQYNAKERGDLAETANSFLEAQLEDAKSRLEAQDKKLQAFRERHAGRLPTQMQYNLQAIQTTQTQRQALVETLARDRDRKLMLERLYNDALEEPPAAPPVTAPAPGAGDPAQVVTMTPSQQLDVAKTILTQLSTRLREGHPDLTRARTRVAELEKLVAEAAPVPAAPSVAGLRPEELQRRERINERRAEIESLDRQIAFKESEEKRLGAIIRDYQVRIEAVPGVESEWLSLSRDYDTLQASHRELLTKTEAARQAAALENRQIGEQFRTLDAPRVPIRPISPQRSLITATGLGVGLAIGLLLVALLEFGDSSFRTEADVERVLELPVVALVPQIATPEDLRRLRVRRATFVAASALGLCASGYMVWTMGLWRFIV
jgi:polysaccharide chain length determinant protein (PEP-CTERM system associated)